VMDYAA